MADQFKRSSFTMTDTALIKLNTIAIKNNMTVSRTLSLILDAQKEDLNLTEKETNGQSKKVKRG